jgi:PilZ domain
MGFLAGTMPDGAGMSMANRGKLRRKMVLPVTVVRGNSQEKQLAHTLDVTENSARLGGLKMLLDLGEVIEIQRGGRKAKFEVYWMGTPGTELEGQAGVRGVGPTKSIWSIHLPADQPDIAIDALHLRQGNGKNRSLVPISEQRESVRHECNTGATLRAPGSNYPFRVQVKSIHLGGIEVETITTLPLNTVVNMEMRIEGILLEIAGMVSSSTHRVGMEISFHKMTPEAQRKIVQAMQKLRQRAWDEQQVPPLPQAAAQKSMPPLARTVHARELAGLCKALCADFHYWQSGHTETEIEELRKAVAELQEVLAPSAPFDMRDYMRHRR